jgi:hypothetical protein
MGLSDWFRSKFPDVEELPPEPRAEVDWSALEDALTTAIATQVGNFAEAHGDETYYGFALDCHAYYANVLFCLNTPESLEKSVKHYAKDGSPEEIARQTEDLLWGLGDWKYQGFNLDSPDWPDAVPMLEDFAELPSDEDTEEFLCVCCRALLRAEKNGAFDRLRKTPDFRVACIDHDEDVHGGDRRLDRIRASA